MNLFCQNKSKKELVSCPKSQKRNSIINFEEKRQILIIHQAYIKITRKWEAMCTDYITYHSLCVQVNLEEWQIKPKFIGQCTRSGGFCSPVSRHPCVKTSLIKTSIFIERSWHMRHTQVRVRTQRESVISGQSAWSDRD